MHTIARMFALLLGVLLVQPLLAQNAPVKIYGLVEL